MLKSVQLVLLIAGCELVAVADAASIVVSPPTRSNGLSMFAVDVSGDGSTLVGTEADYGFYGWNYNQPFPTSPAATWRPGGPVVPLGQLSSGPEDGTGFARATSFDGSVVVGQSIGGGVRQGVNINPNLPGMPDYHAFRHVPGEGRPMVALAPPIGTPTQRAEFHSRATGVSADGSVVVGTKMPLSAVNVDGSAKFDEPGSLIWAGLSPQGFVWRDATGPVPIDQIVGGLLVGGTRVTDISSDGGTIIGDCGMTRASPATHGRPFIWNATAGLRLIPLPFQGWGRAMAISPDGRFVAGHSYGMEEVWVWSEQTGYTSVAVGFAESSEHLDFTADGSTLVGTRIWGVTREGFIWSLADGYQPIASYFSGLGLETTGFREWTVSGISDDGHVIVGNVISPGSTFSRAYAVTVPEPSFAAALCSVAVVLRLRRRCCAQINR